MKYSVSIVIPAYNEQENITDAVYSAVEALKTIIDYELIVIDDGSTDDTGKIVDQLARRNRRIKVIHHPVNQGFGATIREGIASAGKMYFTQFHGDNDAAGQSLKLMLTKIGTADIIISYTADTKTRSLPRRLVSRLFVTVMNILFGMKLKYFNGCFLTRTELIRSVNLASAGFAIYAEAKVRLIKSGAGYVEIPFHHIGRKFGRSKAVSVKSAAETMATVWSLVKDFYLNGKSRTLGTPS